MATDTPPAGVGGKSVTHLLADYDRLMAALYPTIHEMQVRLSDGNCTADERDAIERRLDALKPRDRRPNARVIDPDDAEEVDDAGD